MISERELKKINECRDTKSKILQLEFSDLKEIPEEIFEFVWLEELYLSGNKISEIRGLEKLTNLTKLSLAHNKINEIKGLDKLVNLRTLILYNNEISEIKNLDKLTGLEVLELSNNNISEIKGLETLLELKELGLGSNQINQIKSLNQLKKITHIDLSYNFIKELEGLDNLININGMNFSNNPIKEIGYLNKFNKLKELDLSFTGITEIKELFNLTNLTLLNLGYNEIENIEGISNLKNLKSLDLNSNEISNIDALKNMKKLTKLHLSGNKISDISSLNSLTNLVELFLMDNEISQLPDLRNLKNLKHFYILRNPFQEVYNLSFKFDDDQFGIIKNILEREMEQGENISISMPVKIILLGNHSVGKSSLLNYLQTKRLNFKGESTHILKIENYPSKKKLPEAIFYDFGGQDYYHGIYRAFLSNGSAYLLLWDIGRDNNFTIIDSKKQLSQNFKVSYWLSLKNYIEDKSDEDKRDPLLLIQTRADENEIPVFENYNLITEIYNRFYISLNNKSNPQKNKAALNYLRNEIESIINKKKLTRKDEKKWYVDFYIFVLNNKSSHPISIKSLLKYYKPTNKKDESEVVKSLKIELKLFHNQGLVLYYPEIDESLVWLNPEQVVRHIHDDILKTDIIKEKKGIVPISDFSGISPNIIALLKKQKVIFEHKFGDNGIEYIVPNFLPLVNEKDPDYSLFTFGLQNPIFVLKFLHFIPIGIINQLICFYGNQPDKKKFWRNQILFTFQNAKILVQLNFELLEIKVFATFNENKEDEQNRISKYLFYTIMSFYWDKEIFSYDDFSEAINVSNNKIVNSKKTNERENLIDNSLKVILKITINSVTEIFSDLYFWFNKNAIPNDLYLSTDNKYFVKYIDLVDHEVSQTKISALVVENDRNFSLSTKEIAVKPYEIFIDKEFTSMKKVFISYSKDDLSMVHRFRDALIPLHDDGIIENPWYCTFLEAGSDWDSEIQKNLEQSDIVFFMCSISFLRTKYIREHEIKAAKEKNKIIIPIIINFCEWENYLGDHTALPYIGKPISDFNNQDLGWLLVIKGIRWSLEKDENKKEELDKQIRKLYERLVDGKLDN